MPLTGQTTECIGASTIVALAEGGLDRSGRAAVLHHVDGCPNCAELVAQAVRLSSSDRTALGRYFVVDELGRGGMGRVLLAYDPELRRELALKIVRPERIDPARGLRALRREARALAKLQHPNIVNVFDVQADDDELFIAMEYINGIPLDRWLKRGPNRSEIVDVFVQAGAGLQAAHDAQVVHRDFKPSNVILREDGRVVVLDFGLAQAVDLPATVSGESNALTDTDAVRASPSSTANSAASVVAGTPLYMAPEQYEGRADPRSDQYAFCVALAEALTGRWPFASRELKALAQDKAAGRLDRSALTSVPRRLLASIERGLSADPAARWSSVADLCDRLRPRRRSYVWPAAAVGALAAAATAAAVLVAQPPGPCEDTASKLEGSWDAGQRAQASDAFEASGVDYATEQFELTARRMDAFASQWEQAFNEACLAGRDGSQRLLDARMQCLRSGRDKFRVVGDLLGDADAELVRNPSQHLDRLPAMDQCAADGVIEQYPPLAQERAAAAEQLSADLYRAALKTRDHDFERARVLAEGLVERARAIDHPPLLLRALAVRVGVALYFQDPNMAALFDETYALARELDDAHEAAETALSAASTYSRRGEFAEAERWLDLARIEVERSDEPHQRSQLANARSGIAADNGEFDESIELAIEAVDHMREATPDGIDFAIMLANLSGSLRFKNRFAEAAQHLDEAEQIVIARGGQHHPVLQHIYLGQAALLDQQRQYERAIPQFERAIEWLIDHQGPEAKEIVTARQGLGRALTKLERHEEAQRELEQSLAIAKKISIDPHELALIYLVLGSIKASRGDRDAAEADFVRGLGALDKVGASPRAKEIRGYLEERRKGLEKR